MAKRKESLEDKLNQITDENKDHSNDDYEVYDLYKCLCNVKHRFNLLVGLCAKYEKPERAELTVKDALELAKYLQATEKSVTLLGPYLDRYPKLNSIANRLLGVLHCVKMPFGRILTSEYISACDFYGVHIALNAGLVSSNVKKELDFDLLPEVREKTIGLGYLVFEDDLFVID